MKELKSSVIKRAGHDPATRTAKLEFSNGKTYDYVDVDPADFEALCGAESVGGHFAKHKHKFKAA